MSVDADVLQAAKGIAMNRGTTTGRAVPDLTRQAVEPRRTPRVRNGVPLMPRRRKGRPRPTMERVNQLRDET